MDDVCTYCGKPLAESCIECGLRHSYGHLTEEQWAVIGLHVAGKVVNDYGAGNMAKSVKLLQLGARRVLAIDKALSGHSLTSPILKAMKATFSALWKGLARVRPDQIIWPDVAFLSWPFYDVSEGRYLVDLLGMSDVVIYAGKNTDGATCGDERLFKWFLRRRLLAYVPERRTTLLVLGEELPAGQIRKPTGEEHARLEPGEHTYETALDWDMAEGFIPVPPEDAIILRS